MITRYASIDNLTANLEESKSYTDTLRQDIENQLGVSLLEPKEEDIPKVFIDGVIPTTKDDVLAELTYISKTLSFHSYIEIKC